MDCENQHNFWYGLWWYGMVWYGPKDCTKPKKFTRIIFSKKLEDLETRSSTILVFDSSLPIWLGEGSIWLQFTHLVGGGEYLTPFHRHLDRAERPHGRTPEVISRGYICGAQGRSRCRWKGVKYSPPPTRWVNWSQILSIHQLTLNKVPNARPRHLVIWYTQRSLKYIKVMNQDKPCSVILEPLI